MSTQNTSSRSKLFRLLCLGLLLVSFLAIMFVVVHAGSKTNEVKLPASGTNPVPQMRVVQGSWVNVRAAPGADAPVLTHLIINTPVELLKNQGKFCEIRKGQTMHGYIACNLLGEKTLSIADLGAPKLNDGHTDNPDYSAPRAFWLEPGYQRLLDAGKYFERTMLSAKQKELESSKDTNKMASVPTWGEADKVMPKIQRFPLPEFEAMKELMKKGVIAAPENSRDLPLAWDSLKQKVQTTETGKNRAQFPEYTYQLGVHLIRELEVPLVRELELPAIRPSYFKSVNDVVEPSANTETISHRFHIPYTMTVTKGAHWQYFPGGTMEVVGAWDVGDAELALTQKVYKNTFDDKGHIRSETSIMTETDSERFPGCDLGFRYSSTPATTQKLLDWSEEDQKRDQKRSGLFYFYTQKPLTMQQAKVSVDAIRKLNINSGKRDTITQGQQLYFDIDGDGVFDLAVWQGWRSGGDMRGDQEVLDMRILFINVAGRWHLLASDDLQYRCECPY